MRVEGVKETEERLMRFSLDEVLEGVSVRPLFCEGGPVPDGGEVAQAKPVLHALVSAGHFLLL